jgi:hypothetical protein
MTPGVRAAFTDFRNCDAVRYVDYWEKLEAKTPAQLFQRFLFAYCSVHTTWEGNINGYKAIKDHEAWLGDHQGLRTKLVHSGVGLHNNRAKWIDAFSREYWAHPARFVRQPRESWASYRDRLEGQICGLGHAKTSFALELAYPLTAQVLCLDVHMLRLYGMAQRNGKLTWREYQLYEADWVGRAQAAELPPYIVKQLHWDRLQGKNDSRYWSHVLEG